MKSFTIGQRWISDMEPELGVGIITEITHRMVRITFPAAETERLYAIASAPIQRLEFKIGDTIQTKEGEKFTVTTIENYDGLLTYVCGDVSIGEKNLSSVFSFTSPKDRLLGGFYDTNAAYSLRVRALKLRAKHAHSPAFGFIGGRIDLIPHQLYVAAQTASRQAPRVLLSDEVGLGKTIEACLILHRLLLSRRINRVLIFVPESLVHQWFIELLRRFNLVFRIFDADYMTSLPEDSGNPFDDDQLALVSQDFLLQQKNLALHALHSDWDMVIVDEAHHLQEGSPDYLFIEQLSQKTKGLLLLTATPEQLGHRSHFARLRLLDPSRYFDFDEFEQEAARFHQTAEVANKLLNDAPLQQHEFEFLRSINPNMSDDSLLTPEQRQQKIRQLVDRYGLGRVIFRNTRAAIPDFPKRQAFLIALDCGTFLPAARAEFQADCDPTLTPHYDFKDDPRISWLVSFLKKEKSKILLICHSIDKALAIEAALQKHIAVKSALFHERMTLLQRDRNAAWFAEENGAQLLICSEIGSEGRNFQFSHHLVLFDVPLDPEVLEQRIGRLDRIGQKQTIHIHVPYMTGAPQEALVHWYHHGFQAFEQNAADAFLIYEKFGDDIREIAALTNREALTALIEKTQSYHAHMSVEMERGRNRLLELNSFDKDEALALIQEIRHFDHDPGFAELMLRLFQHFDVHHDELTSDIHVISRDHLTHADFPFPAFRSERVPVTFDRQVALSREEVEYITPDHPMAMGAIDLLVASEKGNAVLAIWPSDTQDLLLEAFFIHEAVAPAWLHVDRFFPPSPLRILVNFNGEDLTHKFGFSMLNKSCKNMSHSKLFDNPEIKQEIFPKLLEHCQKLGQRQAREHQQERLEQVKTKMDDEISRLLALKQVNSTISQQEIEQLHLEKSALVEAISHARLRLDAIRFIIKGQ